MKYIKLFEEYISKYDLDYDNCEYYIRYSSHIQDDLNRGWSSWNFGEDGFNGSYEELEESKDKSLNNNKPFYISGFELWDDDIKKADIRELYKDYWCLVDNTKTKGLAGHYIQEKFTTLSNMLDFIKNKNHSYDGSGDGNFFDTEYAKIIYSDKPYSEYGFHIIELGENLKNI
jgi:hypothetical protein